MLGEDEALLESTTGRGRGRGRGIPLLPKGIIIFVKLHVL